MTQDHIKNGERRICVVTPYVPSVTETFIRAHIEQLPAKTTVVHGWRPSIGDRTVLSLPALVYHKAKRVLTGSGLQSEQTAAYLKVFQRFKIDAVLVEYGDMGVHIMDATKQSGIPLIVHFHGYDASVISVLEEQKDNYPRMFEIASSIIAVSHAMRRKLIELGAPEDKVQYNPCGVDCEQFSGGDPASAPPHFLSVGRFTEKKAPQISLRAFAKTLKSCPDARLRMIGEGPLLQECEALAKELNLTGAVDFLGWQEQPVIMREMQRARALVQHSVMSATGDCEGTPVSILEAGATGLPVVSTRHAGIPDVIIEGKTGLLVDEHDEVTMAQHMIRVAQEPELAGRMGRAAREHIQKNFSKELRIGNLWSIINSCIELRTTTSRS